MKQPIFFAAAAVALFLSSPRAEAAVYVFEDAANVLIPDGSSSGLARSITVSSTFESVVSIDVSLEISAAPGDSAFVGDLYVYLTNGTDKVVLINRAGRDETRLSGYGDNQTVNVTFTTSATADIHLYRTAVTGSETIPLSAALTGNWRPDGRDIDPESVLSSDTPGDLLDVFAGGAADGTWSLFVADLSGGAQHQLVSWGMTMTTVPEPSSAILGLAGGLALAFRRRR